MHFSPLPAELHPLPSRLFGSPPPPAILPNSQPGWLLGNYTLPWQRTWLFPLQYITSLVLPNMAYFLNVPFFSTQLSPISTRLYIITIINNCQSAASVQHSGCLISMAQHLFCGEADYFLQQARPITLVKWYHINQNLTRWQIWSYQIPRDTITNMSLSQELSAGMPPLYQIYHPTGSQRVSGGN